MVNQVALSDPFVLRVDPARLCEFCTQSMLMVGMSEPNARITAENLVRTDMRGIFTHGTVSLRRYVQMMHGGAIDPQAVPEVIAQGPAWAQVDAQQSVGMVAGHVGMTVAIDKAKQAGVGFVGVRHSNHFGAASAYTLMAVDREMIGLAMSNTDVIMSIPGGRGAQIGNSPLSYAIPAQRHGAMVLDIAMSTVAGGKVNSSKSRGIQIPGNWITDLEGRPTSDASFFPDKAALTPMAAHKGYGLALLVESLAGVLAGAAITTDILSWAKETQRGCNEGHSFLAIDVGAMMPKDLFYDRIDELMTRMKTAPKAEGSQRTYVPGEMEDESEQLAHEHGVALTQMALENLAGLAKDVGLYDELPFDAGATSGE